MYTLAKYIVSRALYVYLVFLGNNHRTIARYFEDNRVRRLQLGSGTNRISGWLNSDYFPRRLGVIHLDARREFPLDSDSFDFVFSEHMIEHIPYVAGVNMLKEIYRILKPGGKLRISTPDLHFLLRLLDKETSGLEKAYMEWATGQFSPFAHPDHKAVFAVNNFFYNFGHTFIYEKMLLGDLLSEIGFSEIKEVEISRSDDPELSGLENESKIPKGFLKLESVIFEARK